MLYVSHTIKGDATALWNYVKYSLNRYTNGLLFKINNGMPGSLMYLRMVVNYSLHYALS